VLPAVIGQRGEGLREWGASARLLIRLDGLHIRTNQAGEVGGSVLVDVQLELDAARSQEREIGERVGKVVGGDFEIQVRR